MKKQTLKIGNVVVRVKYYYFKRFCPIVEPRDYRMGYPDTMLHGLRYLMPSESGTGQAKTLLGGLIKDSTHIDA
jgi:hypothetical protein